MDRGERLVEDLTHTRGGWEAQVARQSSVSVPAGSPEGAGSAEDAKQAVFGALDVVEQLGFVVRLADPAGGGCHLEMRVDGGY